MPRWLTVSLALVFVALVSLACAGAATPTPRPTPVPTSPPTTTPTPVPPSPTPTATATATPTRAASPTPSPVPAQNTPAAAQPTATPTRGAQASAPSFEADILPILKERCVKCHSGPNAPRGLQLDSYEHVMKGSAFRAEVVPGKPEESEIVKRIKGISVPRMPFDGPPFLSDEQIRLIEAWIAAGAKR